eukprot:1159235-Pelagomonas_calceolata.AAC.3
MSPAGWGRPGHTRTHACPGAAATKCKADAPSSKHACKFVMRQQKGTSLKKDSQGKVACHAAIDPFFYV